MKKSFKIEGVHIDLDALKAGNIKNLKDTGIFSHLPEAKQAAAYSALQAEYDAHNPAPATVTVEKGKAVKEVAAEEKKSKNGDVK